MKRWHRILLGTVLVLVAVVGAAISATVGWRPILGPETRPLTDRRFEPSPSRLERGEYLVRSVTGCLFCHSDLDPATEGFPIKAGRAGSGRSWAPEGLPWLTAPNISADRETGAGGWTDDAIARAIREGVSHDGRALFPLMPYMNYRSMSDEDLASVIAYVRSLPAIAQAHPPTTVPFPASRMINLVPRRIDAPVPAPDLSTPEKRGAYLVTLASCADCHTPMDARGQFITGLEFAGGHVFHYADQREPKAAANITPSANGIPYYNEDLFVEVIRTGRVRERKITDMMPWGHYRNMTDEDLRAMFAYLKTLTPVDHYVDNALPATACARCELEHGGGEKNRKRE